MIIIQQDYPLQNSSASTSDWIGQIKGRVIYACDLDTLFSESKVEIFFGTPLREPKEDIKNLLNL